MDTFEIVEILGQNELIITCAKNYISRLLLNCSQTLIKGHTVRKFESNPLNIVQFGHSVSALDSIQSSIQSEIT
jgi:hypothetical protein